MESDFSMDAKDRAIMSADIGVTPYLSMRPGFPSVGDLGCIGYPGSCVGPKAFKSVRVQELVGSSTGDNLGLRGGPRRLPVSGVEPAWGRTLAHLHHCQAASAARKSPCRTVAMSKLGVRKVEARWTKIPSLCLPRQALPRQQCGRQASP